EAARGRIRVVAGTGSYSTSDAIEMTKHAERAGAAGALVVNPYYNKPTQEGLYRHFRAVAESVAIPILVYNIQSRTAVNVETDTIPSKEAMAMAGMIEPEFRLPMCRMSDANREKLRAILKPYGLIK